MNVTMVPFGNARFSKSGKLECQHGADECTANSWEQCAISLYPDFEDHWPFYLCLEKSSLACGEGAGACTIKAAPRCARSSGLSEKKLKACVDDPEMSMALQHKFAQLTPAKHQYTPWVLVDGKLSPSDGDKILHEVCAAYHGEKPAACSHLTTAPAAPCPAIW
mmetsp:Transcript_32279/g.75232  ORF Transcript_32279/g.75232 Transcript_32279/m.75232 type:complete len:164 (-) Transcript_32279:303-794(-)